MFDGGMSVNTLLCLTNISHQPRPARTFDYGCALQVCNVLAMITFMISCYDIWWIHSCGGFGIIYDVLGYLFVGIC